MTKGKRKLYLVMQDCGDDTTNVVFATYDKEIAKNKCVELANQKNEYFLMFDYRLEEIVLDEEMNS